MADQTIPSEGQILYQEISRFVKRQSARAAAQGDDLRARAVGFLMSLYQRRLASSTYALRHSLENRARRLTEGLKRARELARTAPPDIPSPDELEEMEDQERKKLEDLLETRMAVISVSGLGRIPRISGALRSGWEAPGQRQCAPPPAGSESAAGRARCGGDCLVMLN